MTAHYSIRNDIRRALFVAAIATATTPALAADDMSEVVVTGSRIQRPNEVANSPIAQVTSEQLVERADITLETMLNTLPQVSPGGTTTSNNPGNGGRADVDLRGLGPNRNVVLIDGRRAMVSSSNLTVDLNTIPAALIESVEIITGGAGAAYGADAIAGAVNIKLKKNFEGVDLRYSISDSAHRDSKDYSADALLGANFGDGKGNAVFAFNYTNREGLIKSQRPFAAVATATTTYLPEGLYFPSGNAPTQASVDALFATYGAPAGSVPAGSTLIGFHNDGTLFSRGVFNSPLNVQNFRYPIDLAVNTNLYPDVYSYNFDSVNILTLPLERRSFFGNLRYRFDNDVEVFSEFGWTNYSSTTALAPTPIPTVSSRAPGQNSAIQVSSPLVQPGQTVANLLIVPVTNPFIPAAFQTLLATRTGDNATLVGSGATEPFLMRQRTLTAGLRASGYENDVVQYLIGAKAGLGFEGWEWEAYASEGRTKIAQTQEGNINTQRLQQLLEAADGGASQCAGGFNPFGRKPVSQACIDYLQVKSTITRDFTQRIIQGFVTGDLGNLPGGTAKLVLGAEERFFRYDLDPGSAGGPISGFNATNAAGGTNKFKDVFVESLIPILKDAPAAKSLELNVGYRHSKSEFSDTVNHVSSSGSSDNAYKVELSWQPLDDIRFRGSYQRAVRAPNFNELFNSNASAPQYFDPCSVTTAARTGANAAQMTALCIATGLSGAGTYVQTPGTQASITITGNTNLKPEKGDTITFGAVYDAPWDRSLGQLRASLDYYRIKIDGTILIPDPNVIIAACYNYYGGNPTYSATNINCRAIVRAGGDILQLSDPNSAGGLYPGINAGVVKTDGLDLQADYTIEVGPGQLGAQLQLNYLLSFEQQENPSLPAIDYAGTAGYFGEGLGIASTFPKLRATANLSYALGDFTIDSRIRFIDSMSNRASRQFPGETSFTGPEAVTYVDLGGSWKFLENSRIRIGVNNVFDKDPPTYAPNVQSGTDPSLYDVIGRRIYAQINTKF